MRAILKNMLASFLQAMAKCALARNGHTKIIAITGNVGKTTTKEAIAALLRSANIEFCKSPKTYNSETGVPLSVLGLKSPGRNPFAWIYVLVASVFKAYFRKLPKFCVLEVGTDRPGDISAIAEWLKPDIAVLTALPKYLVHAQNFSSEDELIAEKLSLFKNLKDSGFSIVNGDDGRVVNLFRERAGILYFGYGENADFKIKNSFITYYPDNSPKGVEFEVCTKDECKTFSLDGTLAQTSAYAFACAWAVVSALGIDFAEDKVDEFFEKQPGRMRILKGKNSTTIIDDSYNSSPKAAIAALDALGSLNVNGEKIAVLGEMKELGDSSLKAHAEVGAYATGQADRVVLVGDSENISFMADSAKKTSSAFVHHFKNKQEAQEYIWKNLSPGNVLLFKASRSERFETLLKPFVLESEHFKLIKD